jgi:DNA-binding winged helix-turn-helix (wHTH) protein
MHQVLHFSPFRLDLSDERLWRADNPIQLRPKTYGVLAHLIARAPSLVTHAELHSAVWGDCAVTPGTLTQSISELRAALDDRARPPRFIETAHRRGYRFIASVSSSVTGESSRPTETPRAIREDKLLVGRESELGQLETAVQAANLGRRQLIFVTGEPGIGKTTLVRSFLQKLADQDDDLRIAWGHCVELHGESEAYLPILNALD